MLASRPAVDASLRAKLDSIADRHDELGTMLCDPEITQDKVRFLALSREHGEIAPLALAYEAALLAGLAPAEVLTLKRLLSRLEAAAARLSGEGR